MKRTRISSSKLRLSRETVRRLVDSDLVHAVAGDVQILATADAACWTQGCPPSKGPV
jgi:hypothetical protein